MRGARTTAAIPSALMNMRRPCRCAAQLRRYTCELTAPFPLVSRTAPLSRLALALPFFGKGSCERLAGTRASSSTGATAPPPCFRHPFSLFDSFRFRHRPAPPELPLTSLPLWLAQRNYTSSTWHHDRCGRRLKLFLFLHDVAPNGRPTLVASGSHNQATTSHTHARPSHLYLFPPTPCSRRQRESHNQVAALQTAASASAPIWYAR
eukprot:3834867-Prymnesium_polylepis.2